MLSRRQLIAAAACGIGAAPLLPTFSFADTATGPASANVGVGTDRLVLLGTKGGPAVRGFKPSPSANLLVYK